MKNSDKIFLVLYILYFTILALSQVGDKSCGGLGESYPWYLPLLVFAFLAMPGFFGYMAGKKDEQKRNLELLHKAKEESKT